MWYHAHAVSRVVLCISKCHTYGSVRACVSNHHGKQGCARAFVLCLAHNLPVHIRMCTCVRSHACVFEILFMRMLAERMCVCVSSCACNIHGGAPHVQVCVHARTLALTSPVACMSHVHRVRVRMTRCSVGDFDFALKTRECTSACFCASTRLCARAHSWQECMLVCGCACTMYRVEFRICTCVACMRMHALTSPAGCLSRVHRVHVCVTTRTVCDFES